jgi:prepilin signal peptidase PulO-like enzyme (type II secretory pathway)
MGVMLGFEVTVGALFLAYIGGAAVAVYCIARKQLALQSRMAFGTFLTVATFGCLLWGAELVEWYLGLLL